MTDSKFEAVHSEFQAVHSQIARLEADLRAEIRAEIRATQWMILETALHAMKAIDGNKAPLRKWVESIERCRKSGGEGCGPIRKEQADYMDRHIEAYAGKEDQAKEAGSRG